jgi:hypothetical protein
MYPYFYIVVELAWLRDSESCAGSTVTTVRASHAGNVKLENPD